MYRFNIRFDSDDASAQQAAEYLLSLRHGNRNRFVIEAILAQMPGKEHVALMEELRQVIREEIRSIPVSAPQQTRQWRISHILSVITALRMR